MRERGGGGAEGKIEEGGWDETEIISILSIELSFLKCFFLLVIILSGLELNNTATAKERGS